MFRAESNLGAFHTDSLSGSIRLVLVEKGECQLDAFLHWSFPFIFT